MENNKKISNIIIYQAPDGAIEFKGDYNKETIWASLDQISKVFNRDKSVISRHIKNIYKEKELKKKSVVAFFATTAKDKKVYKVEYFNLDMIISVGYRVNSKVATNFRKWATQILKKHITEGYTINKKLLENNYKLFEKTLSDIKDISQNKISSDDILELIKIFSYTWFSLDAFDKNIKSENQNQETVKINSENLYKDILKLKKELISKNEATEIFAKEIRKDSLESILGNIFQKAFNKDFYPSIESKASHLLYFIIKDHPFLDGNKRSGAFSFIWFLNKVGFKFKDKITPEALTAITLLIAISDPKDKERIVNLVGLLLRG